MPVEHYVQYHNRERFGPASEELVIHTSKPVDRLPGHVVWLVLGEGRPRRYFLGKVFVVDQIGPLPGGDTSDDAFTYYARGTEGRFFRPPILLSDQPWFPAFLRSQANFSLGLRRVVRPPVVAALQALAAEHGCIVPSARLY